VYRSLAVVLCALSIGVGVLSAGPKTVMHCFTFTPIESATSADWDAFYKSTDGLPGKIPGLIHVWSGKLMNPQHAGDAVRSYGACMEFKDAAAFKAYADNPAHKAWVEVYEKVRQPGTTTFNLQGQ
jgi:antibiotic biosynthesis monooxygenase (ABM) superfamily enzyme